MSRNIILALVVASLVGCASQHTSNQVVTASKPGLTLSQEQSWQLMSGKWYGSQPTKEGGLKQHVVERFADGTYKLTFKISESDGTVRESVEVGNWGVSGTVYFTIFRGWLNGEDIRPSDPTSPYNYDAYKIVNLTKENFEYEHFTSGNKYNIKKVPTDFAFPQ